MQKIATALHNVMKKVGYVQKRGVNDFHKYKYASEADLLRQLRPAMVEEGLMLIPSVTDVSEIDANGNTTVKINYTLVHFSGEVWPHPIVFAGCGNDKNKNGIGDKGLYKAYTGANKYALFKLFQLETGDDPEDDAKEQEELAKAAKLYVDAAVEVLRSDIIKSVEGLETWWKEESQHRAQYGIAKENPYYDKIVTAFRVRKSLILEDK